MVNLQWFQVEVGIPTRDVFTVLVPRNSGTRQAQEDASAQHGPKTLVPSNYERWHYLGLLTLKF